MLSGLLRTLHGVFARREEILSSAYEEAETCFLTRKEEVGVANGRVVCATDDALRTWSPFVDSRTEIFWPEVSALNANDLHFGGTETFAARLGILFAFRKGREWRLNC